MRVLLSALAATLVLAAPASAASPDVVISEIYGGGGNAGATLTNDFIELYNHGSAPVDLSGWSVQYASAAGTSWQATPLTGSIAAGGHYLVQEGAGSGGTTALPTPEASGSIAMSAASGKVALATVSTALACGATCSANASVRDFVGYGAANDFETAAAPGAVATRPPMHAMRPAPTPTTTPPTSPPGRRTRRTAPAVRRRSSSPAPIRPTAPTTCPSTPTSRSRSAARPTRTFTITCATSGAHEFTQSGGPTEFTLDPTTDFAQGESCTRAHRGGRLQLHDRWHRGPADPRHPGRAAPLALRGQGRQRRARRRDGREQQRHLGAGHAARQRRAHVGGHLPVPPERAAAGRHRGHVQRAGAGVQARRQAREPHAHRDGLADRDGHRSGHGAGADDRRPGRPDAAEPRSSTTTRRATSTPTRCSTRSRTASTSTRASRACSCSSTTRSRSARRTASVSCPMIVDNGRNAGLRTPRGGGDRPRPTTSTPSASSSTT